MTCIKGNVHVALKWRDALSRRRNHSVIYRVTEAEVEDAYPITKNEKVMLIINSGYIINQWTQLIKLINEAEWVLIKLIDQSPSILKALSVSLRQQNVSYVVKPSTYMLIHGYINGDFYIEPTRDDASPVLHILLSDIKPIKLYIPKGGDVDMNLLYNMPMSNVRDIIFDDINTAIRFIAINNVLCQGGKVNCECSDAIDCALNCSGQDLSIDVALPQF